MKRKPTGAEIRQAVEYWRTALGLTDWNYTVYVGRMPADEYGSAEVDVPYKRVHFCFYPQRIAEHGETVDEMATHEWAHVMGESLAARALKLCRSDRDREEVSDLEEALATDIGRLILRLHKRPGA